MAAKYYTHFVTAGAKPRRKPDSSEWSGVVELRQPLERASGAKQLKALLAQSFDLESEDIKILHWATVALNPLADFLPFIESPHFKPQASKAWGFFCAPPAPSL